MCLFVACCIVACDNQFSITAKLFKKHSGYKMRSYVFMAVVEFWLSDTTHNRNDTMKAKAIYANQGILIDCVIVLKRLS